jgi:preprotein translocase subunit SecE
MASDKSVPRPQASARTGGDGFFRRAARYLGEVRAELKKTTWPTRQEVFVQTQVVLALLLVIGVFIATWDFILGQIFNVIMRLLGVSPNG